MRRPAWVLLLVLCVLDSASPARDIFVNNVAGDDRFNGGTETARNQSGPCRTIGKALRLADKGDRIVIANTGQPYHESISVQAGFHSGLPGSPFTIEGQGAVLDGTLPVPPTSWDHFRGNIYRFQPRKMSYQQVFLDGKPAVQRRVPATLLATLPKLQPLQWCLYQGHVYFCTEPGKAPPDYALTHTALLTGITLYEVRSVRIRDLVVQGFVFDGVNAHDSAFDAELSGLTCRGNGRSGISIGGSSQVRVDSCLVGDNGESQVRVRGFSRAIIERSKLIGVKDAPEFDHQGGQLIHTPWKEDAAARAEVNVKR